MLLRKLEIMRHMLGLTGMAGLLLMIASLAVSLITILPTHHKLQQKMQEFVWLNTQPKINLADQLPVLDDDQALQKFYRQFPPEADISKVLSQIHQLALDKGIILTVGEYKLSSDANNPNIVRYEIIFPVQANYRNLRDFIEAAREQFPTLGLSEINIKRDAIGDSAAQIKLNYVLLTVRG